MKKTNLEKSQNNDIVAADDENQISATDRLGTKELVNIYEYIPPADIMCARLDNKMREAAKRTVVHVRYGAREQSWRPSQMLHQVTYDVAATPIRLKRA